MNIAELLAKGSKVENCSPLEKSGKGLENVEGNELSGDKLDDIQPGDAVREKLEEIQTLSPEQLRNEAEKNLESNARVEKGNDIEKNAAPDDIDEVKKELSDVEKQKIKEESGWSDEIVNSIRSVKEYEIYRNAGLTEVEIGGHKCLIRSDIDWNQKDEKGLTNAERIEKKRAPLDRNGDAIELHHIGQHADSPLAELTFEEHRGKGNDTILHDKSIESEAHGVGNDWKDERERYWENRSIYNNEGETK